MSYINAYDRAMMTREIHEMLQGFGTTITIIKPLPLSQQTHYDELLDEFNGDVAFNQYNVPAMRYDARTDYVEIYELDSKKYGDRREALLSYKISRTDCENNLITLDSHTEVAIDDTGDIYYIEKIEKKIGEYRIFIRRYPDGRQPVYNGLVLPSADW